MREPTGPIAGMCDVDISNREEVDEGHYLALPVIARIPSVVNRLEQVYVDIAGKFVAELEVALHPLVTDADLSL